MPGYETIINCYQEGKCVIVLYFHCRFAFVLNVPTEVTSFLVDTNAVPLVDLDRGAPNQCHKSHSPHESTIVNFVPKDILFLLVEGGSNSSNTVIVLVFVVSSSSSSCS